MYKMSLFLDRLSFSSLRNIQEEISVKIVVYKGLESMKELRVRDKRFESCQNIHDSETKGLNTC